MWKYILLYIIFNSMAALVGYMGGAQIGTGGAGALTFVAQLVSVIGWIVLYEHNRAEK